MYVHTCFCISYKIVNYVNIACEPCDSSNNGVVIGAIVGVDCTVIIIMVITNVMVWIYYFRKKDHTNKGIVTYTLLSYALIKIMLLLY